MLNRLKQMKLHYEQLAEKIASPEVMADMNAEIGRASCRERV